MALKINSNQLELVALQTICSGNDTLAAALLGNLTDDHFWMEATQEAFVRVRTLFQNAGKAPAWVTVANDPAISESSRKFLKNSEEKVLKDLDEATTLVERLNDYRKARALVTLCKNVNDAMQEDSADIDKLLLQAQETVTNLQVLGDAENDIVRIGGVQEDESKKSDELVRSVLKSEHQIFIPTGFNVFDSTNFGFPLKSLVTIGGTSGGGKSTLALQLMINMASMGYPVAMVSLEMAKEELIARLLSNLYGKINPARIMAGKTTVNEKQEIGNAYLAWKNHLLDKRSYFDIFCPSKAVTVQEVLLTLKPRGFKVVVIDYMSLLAGTSGEDQWRKLGDVAWFCKIWATMNNAVVILLAQVNDDGRLKYSQTVKEHSSCCWLFTADQKTREAKLIEIEQVKARNQRMYNFILRTDLEIMRVMDESEPEVSHMQAHMQSRQQNDDGGKQPPRDKPQVHEGMASLDELAQATEGRSERMRALGEQL